MMFRNEPIRIGLRLDDDDLLFDSESIEKFRILMADGTWQPWSPEMEKGTAAFQKFQAEVDTFIKAWSNQN